MILMVGLPIAHSPSGLFYREKIQIMNLFLAGHPENASTDPGLYWT